MCSFVVDCTGSAVDGLETILSLQHLADCAKRHDTAVTLLTAEFQNHKNGPVSAAVFCLCCTLRCMHERAHVHALCMRRVLIAWDVHALTMRLRGLCMGRAWSSA